MLAGLSGVTWEGREAGLERLLLIRRLWRTDMLHAQIEPERLDQLIRRYYAGEAVAGFLEVAAPAVECLEAAESQLHVLEQANLLALQAETRRPVQIGELLWGPKNGWAIAVEDERRSGASSEGSKGKTRVFWVNQGRRADMRLDGYFASVPQAAKLDGELSVAFHRLVAILDELSSG